MKSEKEQEKQDAVNKILIDLSKSQNILKEAKTRRDFFIRLEEIYYNDNADNFRHYYSDIFSTLTMIDNDPLLGSLEILAQNIETIKDRYKSVNKGSNKENIDISKEILKLYDHVNLEISRISYTKTITNKTQSDIIQTREIINEVNNKIEETNNTIADQLKEIEQTADSLKREITANQKEIQSEYITILGIFASIVVVFVGGINFSSTIFENINKSSIYRLSFTICLVGMVLFNMMWVLLDFIRNINGKNSKKSWIFWSVNGVLVLGLIIVILFYWFKFI